MNVNVFCISFLLNSASSSSPSVPIPDYNFCFRKSVPPCKHPVRTPHYADKHRRKHCKHPVKRPLVNTLKHLVKRAHNYVCVCVDIEATLNALVEALTLLTEHINILYNLVQSLMDTS